MKKTLIAAFLLVAAACQSETAHGPCIGAFEEPNPKLQYRVSARNVVLGVLFSQTIFVPAIVILNETKCPVGTK